MMDSVYTMRYCQYTFIEASMSLQSSSHMSESKLNHSKFESEVQTYGRLTLFHPSVKSKQSMCNINSHHMRDRDVQLLQVVSANTGPYYGTLVVPFVLRVKLFNLRLVLEVHSGMTFY